MTRYLLDTNILSNLIRNPRGAVLSNIARVGEMNVCTSIVVAAELRYGCAKNGSKRLLEAVEKVLGELDVLALEAPADLEYGRLRAQLEHEGRPIGGNDLLIAAHALAVDATIVTANVAEFARVEGLRVENWLL
ncbi:MAG TPA: type II toxin-antitoxin system VapC family toxin [Methylocystis sp.]|nr:type II toxin-antitoxin system VapC family toxin [Methylocystis sp.]